MSKHKDDVEYANLDDMPHALVNNDIKNKEIRFDNHKKGVWSLNISDFGLKLIDPHQYYVTTGEVIAKTRRLEQDFLIAYQNVKRMADILEGLRGDNAYLETRWEDKTMILIIKNPRVTQDKE